MLFQMKTLGFQERSWKISKGVSLGPDVFDLPDVLLSAILEN